MWFYDDKEKREAEASMHTRGAKADVAIEEERICNEIAKFEAEQNAKALVEPSGMAVAQAAGGNAGAGVSAAVAVVGDVDDGTRRCGTDAHRGDTNTTRVDDETVRIDTSSSSEADKAVGQPDGGTHGDEPGDIAAAEDASFTATTAFTADLTDTQTLERSASPSTHSAGQSSSKAVHGEGDDAALWGRESGGRGGDSGEGMSSGGRPASVMSPVTPFIEGLPVADVGHVASSASFDGGLEEEAGPVPPTPKQAAAAAAVAAAAASAAAAAALPPSPSGYTRPGYTMVEEGDTLVLKVVAPKPTIPWGAAVAMRGHKLIDGLACSHGLCVLVHSKYVSTPMRSRICDMSRSLGMSATHSFIALSHALTQTHRTRHAHATKR